MLEHTRWLAQEARRQTTRPGLLEALLSGRRIAYARHRLGFAAVRTLLRTGLHALELQLLAAAFVPWSIIAPLIAYRAACSVAGAAHWGALEVLRERVRGAVRQRQLGRARVEIERWLGVTSWLAMIGVLATLAIETGAALQHGYFELRDAYALACVVRLGADSALRALHSGVFAVRRVYRPLWSSVAPDLLELVVLAVGFDSLGLWSIPVAIFAGGACDAALGYFYVRRAYLQRRLELPRLRRAILAARSFERSRLGPAARAALANLSLQLDALILLLLVYAEPAGSGAFAALYYVLRPLLAASGHGLRVFYFDLKLVEGAGLRALRPHLLHFLERLAVVWAALLAVVTLVVARVSFGTGATLELLLLVPFFVVRSAFALVQLVAFGAGELDRLLRLGVVVLAGLLVLGALGLQDLELVFAVTLLLAGVVAVGARGHRRDTTDETGAGLLDLGAWLVWVARQPQLQLAVLLVHANAGSAGALVRTLRTTHPAAAIARWGRRYVLVAQPKASLTARDLIVASGGTLSEVWVSPSATPAAVFASAARANALPNGWPEADASERGGWPELLREFHARFPSGECVELGSGRGLMVHRASASHLRALVHCIRAMGCGRRTRLERTLPFQIAVFAPGGQAKAVFLADLRASGFEAFRLRVRRASLHGSWPDAFGSTEAQAMTAEERSMRHEPLST